LFKAAVNHLLIGHDPAMLALATDATQVLKEKYSPAVPDISYVPLFDDLFRPDPKILTPEDIAYEYHGPDSLAVICHSSGVSYNKSRGQRLILRRFNEIPKPYLVFSTSHDSIGFDSLVRRTRFDQPSVVLT
jgi:hypothetical protein